MYEKIYMYVLVLCIMFHFIRCWHWLGVEPLLTFFRSKCEPVILTCDSVVTSCESVISDYESVITGYEYVFFKLQICYFKLRIC